MTDPLWLVRAMDAIQRILAAGVKVHRARTHWIGGAARHVGRQAQSWALHRRKVLQKFALASSLEMEVQQRILPLLHGVESAVAPFQVVEARDGLLAQMMALVLSRVDSADR